ncbi:hypothetical protein DL96DRAFT_1464876 [Flagelloscypha sp. PMI_526]|nr:hypothetical protein DL96DRAFT_1464876 [Flagelloscypha sp. PMI_526]
MASSSVSRRLSHLTAHLSSGAQKLKVVVSRNLGPDVMPLLENRKELEIVVWPEDRPCERAWLLENVPGAAGVIVMLSDKANSSKLLNAAGPNLKVVSTMSVGYEHLDLPLLASKGIQVGYTPDVLTDAVADISVMLALMAARNAGATLTLVKDGQWPISSWSPFSFCGPQLSVAPPFSPTRTIGFLGFGRIAQATLSRLIPFGITDVVFTGNPLSKRNLDFEASLASRFGLKEGKIRRVDLDGLAREGDVVFVLAPGGEQTKHLINEAFLKKMKKHAVLVNAARGTLVDSDALAKALREEWIWGAGIDVVEGEPNVGKDHPLVKEPRCVVVPHIGSATFETRTAMATTAANNAIGALLAEPMPAQLVIS